MGSNLSPLLPAGTVLSSTTTSRAKNGEEEEGREERGEAFGGRAIIRLFWRTLSIQTAFVCSLDWVKASGSDGAALG